MSAAVQTIWAELVATSLADGGVTRCVVSPGSRSTPLVAALIREPRLELITLIDERTAAFFALGAARATGAPVALVCTSGTAAAHYLPGIHSEAAQFADECVRDGICIGQHSDEAAGKAELSDGDRDVGLSAAEGCHKLRRL